MGKHGESLLMLKARKTEAFLKKVHEWVDTLPDKERRGGYHSILVYASAHIPLVHMDEVIEEAKVLYYEINQGKP